MIVTADAVQMGALQSSVRLGLSAFVALCGGTGLIGPLFEGDRTAVDVPDVLLTPSVKAPNAPSRTNAQAILRIEYLGLVSTVDTQRCDPWLHVLNFDVRPVSLHEAVVGCGRHLEPTGELHLEHWVNPVEVHIFHPLGANAMVGGVHC